ncbi:hypothetical protein BHM03_00043442 [Ensete ventricosum]|nr:hypothetical protein BHM03_00043442 [Ensete ventricosum]
MKSILLLFHSSVLLLSAATLTAFVTCNPLELFPCSSMILSGARLSTACIKGCGVQERPSSSLGT